MAVVIVSKYRQWLVECVETSPRHESDGAAVAPAGGSACTAGELVTPLLHSDRIDATGPESAYVSVRGRCPG